MNQQQEFIKKALKAVQEMHILFGHPDGITPPVATKGLLELREKLILEEANEALESLNQFDKSNYAKEMCDVLVVSLGGALSIFEDPNHVFSEEFFEPLYQIPEGSTTAELLVVCKDSVTAQETVRGIVFGIVAFLWADRDASLNLQENFFAVHESNMSKSVGLKESAAIAVADLKMAGVNCSYVYNERLGRYLIKRSDNKILKGPSYREPVIVLK